MKAFSYHEPGTVREAVEILAAHGDSARLIAGGTDLVVEMKQGRRNPQHVISLRSLPGLQEIEEDGGFLHIGAMVTHRMIEKSALIRQKYTLLADAVDNLGSVQVRNVATLAPFRCGCHCFCG
ncbi:MAG: FAD binding domain-containing protein [Bacillota bacterium]